MDCAHVSTVSRKGLKRTFDVTIVGAGPAGCASAITAAVHGLDVLLLERDEVPSFKPGDCLHPGAESILKQLGVWRRTVGLSAVRPRGRLRKVGDVVSFEPFGEDCDGMWRAIHILRPAFDKILCDRAEEMGAHRRTGVATIELRGERAGFHDLAVDGNAHRSRYLIDATGRAGWLTRLQGQKRIRTSPSLVAYSGYFGGRIAEDQMFYCGPTGWQWLAQITPDLVNWTAMSFPGEKRPSFSPDLHGLQACNTIRGAGATWEVAPQLASSNVMIVGDAACALDPASSNGILLALMSGIAAADAIASVIRRGADAAQAARRYQQWISVRYAADAQRLSSFYYQLNPDWSGAGRDASLMAASAVV